MKKIVKIEWFLIDKIAPKIIICNAAVMLSRGRWVKSLPSSDATWWHKYVPTLAEVMASCLMAPSHNLKLCWLVTSEVLWHSPEINFTGNAQDIYPLYEFENTNSAHLGWDIYPWYDFENYYRQTSNINHALVGNRIVDHSNVVGAALLQLHLLSRLCNTWLQWIARR